MNLFLMKWTLFFAALMIAVNSSHAWTIGAKGRVTGPVVHTTYFLTPNNGNFPVHAQAYVGNYVNGVCQYGSIYDLGNDMLATGNYVDIDAFLLKSIIGPGYSCMTIYYTSKQLAIETFQLQFDGVNYTASIPQQAEVQII